MNLHEEIKNIKGKVTLDFHNVLTDTHEIIEVDNVFTTAGKNSIASRLKGTTTNNEGIITYCALGTGSTAPTAADTDMETEIERKVISVRSVSGNVATFQTYFTTGEAIGTLREAGLFGNAATGVADSGTMFCHTAVNRTKTANDTLTLTWQVSIG